MHTPWYSLSVLKLIKHLICTEEQSAHQQAGHIVWGAQDFLHSLGFSKQVLQLSLVDLERRVLIWLRLLATFFLLWVLQERLKGIDDKLNSGQ